MKALIFNHHPDNIWQIQTMLQKLDIDCYIATHQLTLDSGADFSSVSPDFKLRKGPNWFNEEELFEKDTFKYVDKIEDDVDFIFTIHRDIAKKINFDHKKLFFAALVSWDLEGMNDFNKYTKISSHPKGHQYGSLFHEYFVPQKGIIKEKKYITQLCENINTPYLNELMDLRSKGYNTKIGGNDSSPDGILDDWAVLQETTLLVHHKDYGVNCNAANKALDTGIPVYISRENREKIALGDLPDELFLFSDDYTVEEAYNKSLELDNSKIQSKYRELRNVELASNSFKKILDLWKKV